MLLKQLDYLEQRFLGENHLRWHAEIQEMQADFMETRGSLKPKMQWLFHTCRNLSKPEAFPSLSPCVDVTPLGVETQPTALNVIILFCK